MREKTEYNFSGGRRGAVTELDAGKTRLTIVIDEDVLDRLRQQVHANGGGDYSALINAALREHTANRGEPLEQLLRRVLRDELVPAA
ncbi:MAG TPA: BrnA antitoxin family protein [Armatimonadota bacterium]|jgi:uncharacterized protein (DUF4415 family)